MNKVTAILISYNERDYIMRAIDSVIAQSSDGIEIEIIIGDDGSDDGSIELIKQIEDTWSVTNSTITHFVMERPDPSERVIPVLRVSSILKKALSMASGDYCVILSADDVFCGNNKFSNAVRFLNEHDDYYSYVTGFRYTDDKIDHIPDVINSFYFWGHFEYFHISCFVFRKIDTSLLLDRICDDTILVYTVLKQGKCKSDTEVTFEYTQRDGSIVHSMDECVILIIEAMMIQDILNDRNPKCGFRFATKSREFAFLRKLYSQRNLLHDEKYAHYLSICSQYKHNIVGRFADTTGIINSIWSAYFYFGAAFDHYVISILWRIVRIFRKKH